MGVHSERAVQRAQHDTTAYQVASCAGAPELSKIDGMGVSSPDTDNQGDTATALRHGGRRGSWGYLVG